ncbi:hypothetical protein DPMN_164197 [Dreissena polymorpha]|uniref:Uncharacterized protein n=1 Tax=Dreissena polymorpha TaxID=45954 RepID=A0A9D4IS48_DREPO|nr:hypothetical protein DPMN_164197 [Dreissena polymorpha]
MNSEHPGGHVFKQTGTIFVHIQGNILTKFHGNWKINVTLKNTIGTNLLTKFHEDQTINVTSRVHIKKYTPPPYIIGTNLLTKVLTRKMPRPLVAMFFEQPKQFSNLSKTINVASRVKNAPPPGGHLVKNIIGMNLLTKFHEDRTINVDSRLLTSHIKKNAPPLDSHDFQANNTIFELVQDIIKTNLLTTFHEDWTINVVSRVITRQLLTPHDAQRTTNDGQKAIIKAHHEHNLLR